MLVPELILEGYYKEFSLNFSKCINQLHVRTGQLLHVTAQLHGGVNAATLLTSLPSPWTRVRR